MSKDYTITVADLPGPTFTRTEVEAASDPGRSTWRPTRMHADVAAASARSAMADIRDAIAAIEALGPIVVRIEMGASTIADLRRQLPSRGMAVRGPDDSAALDYGARPAHWSTSGIRIDLDEMQYGWVRLHWSDGTETEERWV